MPDQPVPKIRVAKADAIAELENLYTSGQEANLRLTAAEIVESEIGQAMFAANDWTGRVYLTLSI